MRPEENIEKFIKDRKPDVVTSRQMDEQTLQGSFAVMEQAVRAKSSKPSVAKIIIRSRVLKLMATAAVIIVAVGLFLSRNGQTPDGSAARPRPVVQSPVNKMSLMSMRMAYRKGGLDALDKQFRDTLNVTGQRSLSISMQELLEGVNGS